MHFYWLCRGQDEFNWFYDLLTGSEGNKKEWEEAGPGPLGGAAMEKCKSIYNVFRFCWSDVVVVC